MKKRTIITIILIIVVSLVIGACIYFVSAVSATYPPIKQYEYTGSFNQLISNISSYASVDSNLTYKITDTVGTKENGYATYIIIERKSSQGDIEYEIKCKESNSAGNLKKTIISLIGVHNKTRTTGGYTINDVGVKAMVDEFDLNIINSLRNDQSAQIISLE